MTKEDLSAEVHKIFTEHLNESNPFISFDSVTFSK
jgi:hypothetical protein